MYTLYSTAYTVLYVLNTVQLPFKSLQYSIYSTVGVEHCTVPLQKMYSTAYTVGIVQYSLTTRDLQYCTEFTEDLLQF